MVNFIDNLVKSAVCNLKERYQYLEKFSVKCVKSVAKAHLQIDEVILGTKKRKDEVILGTKVTKERVFPTAAGDITCTDPTGLRSFLPLGVSNEECHKNKHSDSENKECSQTLKETFNRSSDLKSVNKGSQFDFDKYLDAVWTKYSSDGDHGHDDVLGPGGRDGGDQVQEHHHLCQLLEQLVGELGVDDDAAVDPVQLPLGGGELEGALDTQFDDLLSQIPDLTIRTRPTPVDPGGGGGGGDRGGQGGSGGGGSGKEKTPGRGNPRQLLIKISPERWGCQSDTHTQNVCQTSWFKRFNELYDIIVQDTEIVPGKTFDWEDSEIPDPSLPWTPGKVNTQFLGMLLVHVATRDLPGSAKQYGFADFFNWRDSNDFLGSALDYNVKHCLSGVNIDNPTRRFSPGLPGSDTSQGEVNLRSGLVVAWRMLQDLARRNIAVTVQHKFGNPGVVNPVTTELDPPLVAKVREALGQVCIVLHNIFVVQQLADNLGVMLEEVTEEKIEELEQLQCDFVLGVAKVEDVSARVRQVTKVANQVKKMYRHYESTIIKVSDENILSQAQAQRTFSDVDLLIRFLRNDSSQELPWIRTASKFNSTKTQVTFCGAPLKITDSPSRMMVPIAVTAVNAHIAKIKTIVQKILETLSERASKTPSKAGSVEKEPFHDFVAGAFEKSTPASSKPAYPVQLLKDAKEFLGLIKTLDADDDVPVYMLEDMLSKASVYIQQIQDFQWKHEISLTTEHLALLEDLKVKKPALAGFIKIQNERKRKREIEERELARTLQVAKPVELLATGANISNWLFYHEQFRPATTMARVLKIKETLPKDLLSRVNNELDPDTILSLMKSLFLCEDYLIPLARKEIEKCANCPKPNSPEERKSYTAIWNLIQRLSQAGLERKLDFTMMQLSMQKISRVRQENFEEKWVAKQVDLEGQPIEVQEKEKQKLFTSFIKVQEQLLVRRQLQSAIMKEEPPKKERVYAVRTTKHEKRFSKPADSGASDGEYKCPVCGERGGHPRTKGARIGFSSRTVSRCKKFREMPQKEKLPLIKKLGCERCLTVGSHSIAQCQLPGSTEWLKHEGCSAAEGSHSPSICPNRVWPPAAESQ